MQAHTWNWSEAYKLVGLATLVWAVLIALLSPFFDNLFKKFVKRNTRVIVDCSLEFLKEKPEEARAILRTTLLKDDIATIHTNAELVRGVVRKSDDLSKRLDFMADELSDSLKFFRESLERQGKEVNQLPMITRTLEQIQESSAETTRLLNTMNREMGTLSARLDAYTGPERRHHNLPVEEDRRRK